MLFENISYLTPDFEVAHGFVGVKDGHIVYVGEMDPTTPPPLSANSSSDASARTSGTPERAPAFSAGDFKERYDGAGRLLIPGMYNTHTHIPMTLLRGYAESLSLQDWLTQRIFPFEAKLTDESAYPATLLGIAEMLRFGVVSFTDMYYFTEARVRAITESGIKANICEGLMVFDPDATYEQLPAQARNEQLVQRYHNTLDGRLKIDLNIHSEYISNPQVVRAVGEHAVELGVQTHVHISETSLEHEECKGRRGGLTPVQYFDSLGFFRAPCTAAHCVWTEPEDWALLAERGVTVSANPASNMKLASGFAPIPQMLAAGVNVALGTDGVASNNSHNIIQTLYLFALLYKGSSGDPTVVTPAQALAAATVHGARSQGRPDCGTIEVGKRADLVVLDVELPWMQPTHNLVNNLVYSAQGADVVLTMVDGTVLYRDGVWPTLDVEWAIAATQAAADAIVASL